MVTALTLNGVTLATSCTRVTTAVWAALMLAHLRTFPSPISSARAVAAVRQIVLGAEREVSRASHASVARGPDVVGAAQAQCAW